MIEKTSNVKNLYHKYDGNACVHIEVVPNMNQNNWTNFFNRFSVICIWGELRPDSCARLAPVHTQIPGSYFSQMFP